MRTTRSRVLLLSVVLAVLGTGLCWRIARHVAPKEEEQPSLVFGAQPIAGAEIARRNDSLEEMQSATTTEDAKFLQDWVGAFGRLKVGSNVYELYRAFPTLGKEGGEWIETDVLTATEVKAFGGVELSIHSVFMVDDNAVSIMSAIVDCDGAFPRGLARKLFELVEDDKAWYYCWAGMEEGANPTKRLSMRARIEGGAIAVFAVVIPGNGSFSNDWSLSMTLAAPGESAERRPRREIYVVSDHELRDEIMALLDIEHACPL